MITELELPLTPVDESTDPLSFLTKKTGLSKTQLKTAMTHGAVWLEHKGRQRRLRRARTTVQPPDRLAVYYDRDILEQVAPPPILLDDRHGFSVWVKPSGMLSGGSRFGDHCAIDRVIGKQLDRQTFLVHRLDRFAWGLTVVAHNKKNAARLSEQFQQRKITKIYQAVVHGELLDKMYLDDPVDGKKAVSTVRPLEYQSGFTKVEVDIETGRKHQIRIHLSGAGHPIAGDRQYGSDNKRELQLAAVKLVFIHPESGEQLGYELPRDLHPEIPQDAN